MDGVGSSICDEEGGEVLNWIMKVDWWVNRKIRLRQEMRRTGRK